MQVRTGTLTGVANASDLLPDDDWLPRSQGERALLHVGVEAADEPTIDPVVNDGVHAEPALVG